jgi:DNA-binding MarR family transcriptional regulator
MSDNIDTQELAGCVCQSARRMTRQLTQIYDQALAPSGLTGNQFGVLSRLYGAALGGEDGLPLGVLAQRLGKHASTLNRDLKPLEALRLVTMADDAADRRVRTVRITARGRSQLQNAIPRWRKAQAQVREKLGSRATSDLKRALDDASAALEG